MPNADNQDQQGLHQSNLSPSVDSGLVTIKSPRSTCSMALGQVRNHRRRRREVVSGLRQFVVGMPDPSAPAQAVSRDGFGL
jgi:hypothetical protein